MYRFYEILCVYGTAMKEVIQEKCGDGKGERAVPDKRYRWAGWRALG